MNASQSLRIRIAPDDKALLQRAAERAGVSLSRFVVKAAVERAKNGEVKL